MEDAQQDAAFLRRLDEIPGVGGRRRKGLVGNHVDSAPDRLQDEFAPRLRRSRDGHRVDARIEKLAQRPEHRYARKILLHLGYPLGGSRHHAGQLTGFRRHDERCVKVPAADAVTDQPYPHHASRDVAGRWLRQVILSGQ